MARRAGFMKITCTANTSNFIIVVNLCKLFRVSMRFTILNVQIRRKIKEQSI
jgi:hypothetical protein